MAVTVFSFFSRVLSSPTPILLLEWVRVPEWMGNKLVVCLYEFPQSSPRGASFQGRVRHRYHIFTQYGRQVYPCLGFKSKLQLDWGIKGGVRVDQVLHQLGNRLALYLYGPGQHSSLEVAFAIESSQVPYFFTFKQDDCKLVTN